MYYNSDVLDVIATYVAVTAWFWVQFGNSKSEWLLIAWGEHKKTCCFLLIINFAQFTVCCNEYGYVCNVVVYSTQVYSTIYSKLLLSSTDQSVNYYTLHGFVAFVLFVQSTCAITLFNHNYTYIPIEKCAI